MAVAITLSLTPEVSAASPKIIRLPLGFESNEGQTGSRFQFLARGRGYNLFFARDEIVMRPSSPGQRADAVRMRFAGASDCVRLTGTDALPWKSNYFIGNDRAAWHRDVTNYGRVNYQGIYSGIDLVYYGTDRQLEYDIIVSPGADTERIVLAFQGARTLSIAEDGNLVIETASGSLVQQKPVVYQSAGSQREPVPGRYVLLGGERVGFAVGEYDKSRSLVIDPVLLYSTYLGGTGNDRGRAIAIDSGGSTYITGETDSVNFPGAATSTIRSTLAGSHDVFVAKVNPSGTSLVYATYLGGSGNDLGYAIAVDTAGNAYVTGDTDSPTVAGPGNIPFPTAGPFQGTYNLGGDAFITKINTAGNALVYSSYYGGTGGERGYGIAVDSAGSAYITGSTNSTNLPLVGAMQSWGGSYDAFVAKVSAAGSVLVYSTYLGGSGSEFSPNGGGIAVDTAGNAYVVGETGSANFPGASASSIQPVYGGDFNDGFVAKLNATGSALVYSTYLGGSARESVHGIALDSASNAYVTGMTNSPNFPTVLPFQAAKAGTPTGDDAFVAKVNAAGSALSYSTYLGGTGGDIAFAIAVDGTGNAHIAGWTDSPNFPTVAPIQAVTGGTGDMIMSALNPTGSALVYSTYFGGAGNEFGYDIAVDGAGNRHVTGSTNSTNFPTTTPLQPAAGGLLDAFVLLITSPGLATPTGLTATATTLSSVAVSWNASPGATHYELTRSSGAGYVTIILAATNFIDTSALAGVSYLYMVRAGDALAQTSPYSAPEVATTIFFADDPLSAGVTVVKATHIQQLRQATHAIRTTAGLATAFTDPTLTGLPVRASHIGDIRLQLAEARAVLGLSPMAYTDTLVAGTTVVKAVHVQELRTGVK